MLFKIKIKDIIIIETKIRDIVAIIIIKKKIKGSIIVVILMYLKHEYSNKAFCQIYGNNAKYCYYCLNMPKTLIWVINIFL